MTFHYPSDFVIYLFEKQRKQELADNGIKCSLFCPFSSLLLNFPGNSSFVLLSLGDDLQKVEKSNYFISYFH